MKKLRVGILFGGKSAEHEVSLRSAKNVYAALDPEKFEGVLMGIDKNGKWFSRESAVAMLNSPDPKLIAFRAGDGVALVPGSPEGSLVTMQGVEPVLDVVFPVLHGTNGEDGTMQGLLKLLDVPFVGPGVLGSAVGMDKDVAKRLMRDAGIPIAKFRALALRDMRSATFESLSSELGAPFFVKPANAGSSVGVHKVRTSDEWRVASEDAFRYDTKVLVEEFIKGREIEVAVLGNEDVAASVCGEIIPHHEFYSYEAKYLDENGAGLEIPAKLDASLADTIRATAIATFKALACEGMARVDFFLRGNEIFVNEINTIPGFTNISMYPKLWEASGVPYRELITKLLELAIARHERDAKLKTTFA